MRTLLGSAQTMGARRRTLLLDPMPSRSPPRRADARPAMSARRAHQPPPMGQSHRQAPGVLADRPLGLRYRPEYMEHLHGRERDRRSPGVRPRGWHRLCRSRWVPRRAWHPQRGCSRSSRVLRRLLRRGLAVWARPAHLGYCRPAARLQARMARAANRVLFTGAIHHHHGNRVPGRHPSAPLNSPAPSPHRSAFALITQRLQPVEISPDPYKQKSTALDGVLIGRGGGPWWGASR